MEILSPKSCNDKKNDRIKDLNTHAHFDTRARTPAVLCKSVRRLLGVADRNFYVEILSLKGL